MGRPAFLKKEFGVGSILTLTLAEGGEEEPVLAALREAQVSFSAHRRRGRELVIQTEADAADRFPSAFELFEERKDALRIEHYGVSVMSLEEVFIKIASEDHATRKEAEKASAEQQLKRLSTADRSAHDADADDTESKPLLSKPTQQRFMKSAGAQFRGLVVRRMNFAKRDVVSLGCVIVIPAVMLLLGVFIVNRFGMSFAEDFR